MRVRDYTGPLGILAAGAIGLSLLCSVSAMAMGDLRRIVPIRPLDLVDLAFSNLETAAAFTEQVVTEFVPTATLQPTTTPSLSPISSVTNTPRRLVTITPTVTRRTRLTLTPVIPTATRWLPTNTPRPTSTRTKTRTPAPRPSPTKTRTPIPPTIYPGLPTSTPIPPPTIYP